MSTPKTPPHDADYYWNYLMNADSNPVTILFVAVPVFLGLTIVGVAVLARLYRRRREAEWLSSENESEAKDSKTKSPIPGDAKGIYNGS